MGQREASALLASETLDEGRKDIHKRARRERGRNRDGKAEGEVDLESCFLLHSSLSLSASPFLLLSTVVLCVGELLPHPKKRKEMENKEMPREMWEYVPT